MTEHTIQCPHCGKDIQLTSALTGRVEAALRKEFEAKEKERQDAARRREEELSKKLKEIEEARKSVDDTVARRIALEKARLEDEARKRAEERVLVELKDLRESMADKERLLADARRDELELRKKTRELEEEKRRVELDVARRMDAERDRIRQQTLEMFSEEHRLRDLEKEKKMADMQRMIDDLKRKSEQGPVQAQGEVLELDLEELLRSRFPLDSIEPVPKGVRGADIIQKVYTKGGLYCGSIIWESKRTKAWNDEWITKLKDDQREVKAETAVIVTEAMPRGVSSFALVDGVWVAGVSMAPGIAEALRVGLMQAAIARTAVEGRGEKMEAIYNYLAGPGFRQRVEAIVEAFRAMKEDLDGEKRAMARIWARREKQIERVVMNTSRMRGDIEGITGAALPEIRSLELGAVADGEDEEEDAEGIG